jgi:hypothetical protein
MTARFPISEPSLNQAVEITKVAVAGQNGPWINNGKTVGEFLQAVAEKLEELRKK